VTSDDNVGRDDAGQVPEGSDIGGRPGWSDDDQAETAAHFEALATVAQSFAESFDHFLAEHPGCKALIGTQLAVDEHRRVMIEHVKALFADPRTTESMSVSTRIGYAHIVAGVAPSAYLSSYNLIFPCFHEVESSGDVQLPGLGTFRRRWLHDVCATLDSYHEALTAAWDGERARLESSLAETAARAALDDLTGLLRREPFVTLVEASRRQGLLVVVDLDGFKALNDTNGHLAGDNVLAQIGAVLRANARDRDVVARLGGDEFGIWIENGTSAAAAVSMLSRVEEALPLVEWDIGISAGCVTCSAGSRDYLDLYRQADMAMYRAKRTRRSRSTRVGVASA
jgi:diguanylate cyclase (GGDEF)-like protein